MVIMDRFNDISYIKPPRPKDVLEARQLIIETIDKLSYDQLRELAKSIHTASTNALLSGINGTKS